MLAERTERPIADARIELRSQSVASRSDRSGRFRFAQMAPGEYVIVIRAIGYDSLVAKVRLAASDVVDAEFLLTRSAQTLASVNVEADRSLERMRLAEFDARRALRFGRFIDGATFEKHAASQVDVVIIGRVPGLRTRRVAGKTVLAAQREAKACYPQVVVNGVSVWNGAFGGPDAKRNRETMLFDVNTLRADEIIGFEWHNPSSTPMMYNTTLMMMGGISRFVTCAPINTRLSVARIAAATTVSIGCQCTTAGTISPTEQTSSSIPRAVQT